MMQKIKEIRKCLVNQLHGKTNKNDYSFCILEIIFAVI